MTYQVTIGAALSWREIEFSDSLYANSLKDLNTLIQGYARIKFTENSRNCVYIYCPSQAELPVEFQCCSTSSKGVGYFKVNKEALRKIDQTASIRLSRSSTESSPEVPRTPPPTRAQSQSSSRRTSANQTSSRRASTNQTSEDVNKESSGEKKVRGKKKPFIIFRPLIFIFQKLKKTFKRFKLRKRSKD